MQQLPQSLLPLVWDFGQLSTSVEELYIRQIVNRCVSIVLTFAKVYPLLNFIHQQCKYDNGSSVVKRSPSKREAQSSIPGRVIHVPDASLRSA